MIFNFVEYGRNLDLYAILDGVVLAAAITVLMLLFSYRRNLRVLVMLLSVAVLDILVQVLAGLSDKEILTVARYVTHYAMIVCIVMSCVVYQSDLKAIFQRIANPRGTPAFNDGLSSDDELRETTAEILSACQDMAKQDVGAIIIIDSEGSINDTVLDSGTRLNVAAGCFLPLTQRNVNKEMGTRHRAAIGITEDTDVLSIVVSEETGIISVVKRGEIRRYMTMDKLKDEIEEAFGISPSAIARREAKEEKKHHGRDFK